MKSRVVFFDYLRAFVILLVVLHHAAQAYTTYVQYNFQNYVFSPWPVADPARSYAFDLFQRLQDMYFMSLLFLIAGLFTWPSLVRKGFTAFLRDRMMRLGIPFVLGITVLAPIGEYACYLAMGHQPGFIAFWKNVFFKNYWYSGPVWFLWVLLVFSGLTAVFWKIAPECLPNLSQRLERLARRPVLFSLVFFAGALVCYAVPFSLMPYADLRSWSYQAAPFWVQINRVPLYAFCYFGGVVAGVPGIRDNSLFQKDSPLVRQWALWTLTALALYVSSVIGPGSSLERVRVLTSGVFFSGGCVFSCLALISLFSKFMDNPSRIWDSFAANAYGIFLVHFPIIVWLQFALLQNELSPFVKFSVVASLGFALSWGTAAALRRVPGVKRIL